MLDALNDLLEPHIFPARDDGAALRNARNAAPANCRSRLGRFGAFIGCSNYPECTFTRQMTPGAERRPADQGARHRSGHRSRSDDSRRTFRHLFAARRRDQGAEAEEGREEGSDAPKPEKPKRASLPKGVAPEDIDLDKALALLALPREVGKSPEDGEPIFAGVGRFGPYVKHGKIYASLEDGDDVLTVGLNRAMHLIADKIANPKKGRRFGADPGKVLGEHPDKGGPIVVKNGRYGPYVSHNGVNATLTGDKTPDTVTLDEAIVLLDARAAAMGNSPKADAPPGASSRPARRRPIRRQAAERNPRRRGPRSPPPGEGQEARGGRRQGQARDARTKAADIVRLAKPDFNHYISTLAASF